MPKYRLLNKTVTKSSSLLSLKGLDMVGKFSAISVKGYNFYGFLFALLQTKPLLKRDLLQKERGGEQFFPLRVDPRFQKGDKSDFDRVFSPESVPFSLTAASEGNIIMRKLFVPNAEMHVCSVPYKTLTCLHCPLLNLDICTRTLQFQKKAKSSGYENTAWMQSSQCHRYSFMP